MARSLQNIQIFLVFFKMCYTNVNMAVEPDNFGDYNPDLERVFNKAAKDQGDLCNGPAMFANALLENDPPELIEDRTVAEKALDTIHLPDNTPPDKINKGKRQQRRFRIVRHFLESEDKDEIIAELSQKWGLTKLGIQMIVADGMRDERLPADLSAQRGAVCFVKRQQIFDDGRKAREELMRQISEAKGSREWIPEEFIEDHSEKGGNKTKHISQNKALRGLHAELQESHRKEADSLHMYMEKPASKTDHSGTIKHQLVATEEFKEEFKRIRKLEIGKVGEDETEPAK